MYVKLLCLLLVVLAAGEDASFGKCEVQVKNPVEPDLDKFSGLWHEVGSYPGICTSCLMEFKKDGAIYNVTLTEDKQVQTEQMALEVDEENRQLFRMSHGEEAEVYMYLLAAEYDRFSILYSCLRIPSVYDYAIVLARSKDIDEDTKIKIKNVLLEYPTLKGLKDKFD